MLMVSKKRPRRKKIGRNHNPHGSQKTSRDESLVQKMDPQQLSVKSGASVAMMLMPSWYYEKKELKNSPSVSDGIEYDKEQRYRREGARFIINVGTKMGLRYDTMATGVVYFHRFYMFHSFRTFPRYVTACCCLFLAGKVEETPKKCKDIIKTARSLLTDSQFQQFGDDPKEEVMTLERILLQTIKFDLQVDHPYGYLLKYAKCLNGDQAKLQKMVQMAWTFINDSLCTTLCLQWEPEIIAIALMYLAGKLSKFEVVDWTGRSHRHSHWWDLFVDDMSVEFLEDICHQVLDLYSAPVPSTPQDSPPATPPTKSTRRSQPPSPSGSTSTSPQLSKPKELPSASGPLHEAADVKSSAVLQLVAKLEPSIENKPISVVSTMSDTASPTPPSSALANARATPLPSESHSTPITPLSTSPPTPVEEHRTRTQASSFKHVSASSVKLEDTNTEMKIENYQRNYRSLDRVLLLQKTYNRAFPPPFRPEAPTSQQPPPSIPSGTHPPSTQYGAFTQAPPPQFFHPPESQSQYYTPVQPSTQLGQFSQSQPPPPPPPPPSHPPPPPPPPAVPTQALSQPHQPPLPQFQTTQASHQPPPPPSVPVQFQRPPIQSSTYPPPSLHSIPSHSRHNPIPSTVLPGSASNLPLGPAAPAHGHPPGPPPPLGPGGPSHVRQDMSSGHGHTSGPPLGPGGSHGAVSSLHPGSRQDISSGSGHSAGFSLGPGGHGSLPNLHPSSRQDLNKSSGHHVPSHGHTAGPPPPLGPGPHGSISNIHPSSLQDMSTNSGHGPALYRALGQETITGPPPPPPPIHISRSVLGSEPGPGMNSVPVSRSGLGPETVHGPHMYHTSRPNIVNDSGQSTFHGPRPGLCSDTSPMYGSMPSMCSGSGMDRLLQSISSDSGHASGLSLNQGPPHTGISPSRIPPRLYNYDHQSHGNHGPPQTDHHHSHQECSTGMPPVRIGGRY